jgi:hypothetical protein
VENGCATFIILNADGWVLTASHVVKDLQLFNMQQETLKENESLKNDILNDPNLNDKHKRRRISQIPKSPKRVFLKSIDG